MLAPQWKQPLGQPILSTVGAGSINVTEQMAIRFHLGLEFKAMLLDLVRTVESVLIEDYVHRLPTARRLEDGIVGVLRDNFELVDVGRIQPNPMGAAIHSGVYLVIGVDIVRSVPECIRISSDPPMQPPGRN